MNRPLVATAIALAASIGFSGVAHSAVKVPGLISEGMVLQQKVPVRIWGSADEGEKVTVTFHGQSVDTIAKDGRWSVMLRPLDPGGPFTLTISGTNTIELKDVLVGDVWVCSGQSNMEFHLVDSFDAKKDIDAPADPLLRNVHRGKNGCRQSAGRRGRRQMGKRVLRHSWWLFRRGLLLRPIAARRAQGSHWSHSHLVGRDSCRSMDEPQRAFGMGPAVLRFQEQQPSIPKPRRTTKNGSQRGGPPALRKSNSRILAWPIPPRVGRCPRPTRATGAR